MCKSVKAKALLDRKPPEPKRKEPPVTVRLQAASAARRRIANDEARTRYRTPQSCALRGPRTSDCKKTRLHRVFIVEAASSIPRFRSKMEISHLTMGDFHFGASDEARTRYLHLGKVALYQMSYTRDNKRNYNRIFPFVKGK